MLIKNCPRRVAFLAAKVSMDRKWVGKFARAMNSIPVERAQDYAKAGSGTVYIETPGSLTLKGIGTKFTEEAQPKGLIQIQKRTSTIEKIVSDTELILKEAFVHSEQLGAPPGVTYKCLPYVDQSRMFAACSERLLKGECIGIFPEGGSHDRTEFLPLKAGFTIMALSALAQNPKLNVKIVPCGLFYFHPDKFRSRAVIEFGEPIDIPHKYIQMYKAGGVEKREACEKLLETTYQALKLITVTAPDYDTLMVLQAARRLYEPDNVKMKLNHILAVTRNLAIGYKLFADEPKIKDLVIRVKDYNKLLKTYGVRDHQVKKIKVGGFHTLRLLGERLVKVILLAVLTIPGLIVYSPVIFLANVISHIKAKAKKASSVKIKGKDVVTTWKILVALVLVPLLNFIYTSILCTVIYSEGVSLRNTVLWGVFFSVVIYPLLTYGIIHGTEKGLDILKSLKPLILCLSPGSDATKLVGIRNQLQQTLMQVIEEYGPRAFENYNQLKLKRERKIPGKESSEEDDENFAAFLIQKDE